MKVNTPIHEHSLTELSAAIKNKTLSSVEVTQHFLNRIHKHENLNAFLEVHEQQALKQAKWCDNNPESSKDKPLFGVPIAHKDIFCTIDGHTTCASKVLDKFQANYDATVVKKCAHAGMINLGKLNMDEFAMGSTNENSAYGPVANPWNHENCPGGSSGGSASAVSARLAPIATGSDTGGSIRQPASFTGITGIKPTYGRISRYGMIAFASSLDQAGPMTTSVSDAALMLNIMCGYDHNDTTTAQIAVPDFTKNLNNDIKGLTIGIPEEFFGDGLQEDCKLAVEKAIKTYQELGAIIKPIHLPNLSFAIPTYYLLAPIEAASNLARYDGIHYGYRHKDAESLESLYQLSREYGFGKEVKRRILIGTFASSTEYSAAYYKQALIAKKIITNDYKKAFTEVDAILTPTTTSTAFKLNNKDQSPSSLYLSDIYTVSVNLASLPALSIPVGFDHKNLPIGMQLISNRFNEQTILQLGHAYQRATQWHTMYPELYKG
nr:Asp-tRNA(Asn)/Glu-tRNA(Gln) amidotransferase subunit GatA [Candidatus Comchoanobacter bicostacola]